MPLDPHQLVSLKFPDSVRSYTEKDVMLYALGIGLGHDPMGRRELAFVYENGLRVLPTFACVLGFEPFLLRDTGVNFAMIVHGEEHLTLHRPLASSATIVAKHFIDDVIDKGAGKGALLLMRRVISDRATGETIATIRQVVFCRGDGGFGAVRPSPPVHVLPERAPDLTCDLPTRPDMALLYRLSGDVNPLHADPDVAKAAGFPRPILQGLGTFGVAGHAVLRSVCDDNPSRLAAIAGRFSAPVFPGETLRTEIWRDGEVVSFRTRVVERGVVAINNGRAVVQVT